MEGECTDFEWVEARRARCWALYSVPAGSSGGGECRWQALVAGSAKDFFLKISNACVEFRVLHVAELRFDRVHLRLKREETWSFVAASRRSCATSSLVAMCLTTKPTASVRSWISLPCFAKPSVIRVSIFASCLATVSSVIFFLPSQQCSTGSVVCPAGIPGVPLMYPRRITV